MTTLEKRMLTYSLNGSYRFLIPGKKENTLGGILYRLPNAIVIGSLQPNPYNARPFLGVMMDEGVTFLSLEGQNQSCKPIICSMTAKNSAQTEYNGTWIYATDSKRYRELLQAIPLDLSQLSLSNNKYLSSLGKADPESIERVCYSALLMDEVETVPGNFISLSLRKMQY